MKSFKTIIFGDAATPYWFARTSRVLEAAEAEKSEDIEAERRK